MHIKNVSLLKAVRSLAVVATFGFFFAAEITFNTGCLPKKNDKPTQQDSVIIVPPSEKVITYVNHVLTACAGTVGLMDTEADPGGRRNADSARALWRRGRAQYEQARFAVEEFAPVYHQRIAAWFTPSPPATGFHYLESFLFGADSANVNWDVIYPSIVACVGNIQFGETQIDGSTTINDSSIFIGLEHMLADIDSIKFSGYDSAYSNNSYNDIFGNFNGLDSVYNYYRTVVQDSSAATDTMFNSRLNAARVALQNAGSLAALDKNVYRTNYLYPLDTAVKRVAQVFGVKLP